MIETQNKNVGSAATLEGTVYVLIFYVGTLDNPVTEEVHAEMGRKVFEAERWIKEQAARYGKQVEFKNVAYGMDGSLVMEEFPYDPITSKDFYFPEKVYKKQGFKNGWDLSEYIRKISGCRQWMTLVLCNTKGRSFACPVSDKLYAYDSKKFFLEGCVVFRYKPGEYLLKEGCACYAHEMLHLFGASHLTAHGDEDRYIEEMCRRRYPHSIMRPGGDDVWEREVDEITAWLIGWRGKHE